MVKNLNNHRIQGGQSPVDESWWQAIMEEDEERYNQLSQDNTIEEFPQEYTIEQQPETENESTDWEKATALYENDETIHMKVMGSNRGGLLVSGDGIQGFVPVSHLVNYRKSDTDPKEHMRNYHEKSLQLKIIECDHARGRVVFSERAAQSEPGKRNELLERLKPGDRVTGKVTNITDFGVFVDLGGVEGLIQVSEISWGRVQHPGDAVNVASEIEVFVIDVDRTRARVALSLKQLHPNPWITVHHHYQINQISDAVITSIVPFGAFARLEDGLDGLIHISEMQDDGEVIHPSEILMEGQRVKVRILHIDGARQRLGLSLNLVEKKLDDG